MAMSATTTTTIITTSTTSCQKRNSRLKCFLNEHCHLVDFLSASITICLCLLILLPRVHESFATSSQETQQETNQNVEIQVDEPDDEHNHHHHHRFPAGEVLICIGFFVFYCVGLGLARPQVTSVDQNLYLAQQRRRRRQSTTCCTSTRCPTTGQLISNNIYSQESDELAAILTPDESLMQQQADNDCLMLLNRHHQHHTHSKHHEHAQVELNGRAHLAVRHKRPANYGTTQSNGRPDYRNDNEPTSTQDDKIDVTPRLGTRIVVDQIRIISGPEMQRDQWPHSLRLLVFTIVLGLILIFFDMNVLGMIRAVKVFRATSTGALLYVAFFIMLPHKPANCNSCKEEEEQTN